MYDEERSWLMGSKSNPKTFEAQNNRPRMSGQWCGCARKNILISFAVAFGLYFLLKGFRPGDRASLDFVKVANMRFEADCRPLYLAGFNTHDLVQAALMTTYDYNMQDGKSGRDRIREMFYQASSAGLNVVRTWAHTNDKKFPFQEKPGHYEENTFRALDYILDEAGRHGVRVILSFVDNWKYYNGVDQYVDWSKSAPKRTQDRPEDKNGDPSPMEFDDEDVKKYEVARHALFYNDTDCQALYKNHVSAIVNRKNHLNGKLYKDDSTILAWDLLNEPRCESWLVADCQKLVQEWIEEMSAFVKKEDPMHMVTVGSEGFFAADSESVDHNPQDWAQDMGQNWTGNHLVPDIDFATIHVWPNNWERMESEFQQAWIQKHVDLAGSLGKPLLVEEFGKKLEGNENDASNIKSTRDPVYVETYAVMQQAMDDNKDVMGSLFWRWNLPLFSQKGRGNYGVRYGDSTFKYVVGHAAYIQEKNNKVPPRPECGSECWIPNPHSWSRQCANLPQVCEAYWQSHSEDTIDNENLVEKTVNVRGQLVSLKDLKVFTDRASCCRPGQGAFLQGCSWWIF